MTVGLWTDDQAYTSGPQYEPDASKNHIEINNVKIIGIQQPYVVRFTGLTRAFTASALNTTLPTTQNPLTVILGALVTSSNNTNVNLNAVSDAVNTLRTAFNGLAADVILMKAQANSNQDNVETHGLQAPSP